MKYSETLKVVLQPEYWCFKECCENTFWGFSACKSQHQNTKTVFSYDQWFTNATSL